MPMIKLSHDTLQLIGEQTKKVTASLARRATAACASEALSCGQTPSTRIASATKTKPTMLAPST